MNTKQTIIEIGRKYKLELYTLNPSYLPDLERTGDYLINFYSPKSEWYNGPDGGRTGWDRILVRGCTTGMKSSKKRSLLKRIRENEGKIVSEYFAMSNAYKSK